MLNLFFILVVFLSFLTLLTFSIWQKVSFSWLQKLAFWLVFSLPFERIPSINLGANLRASQILTILGFYFLVILILKKDKKILNSKLNSNFIWLLLFLLFSIPSWFFVLDYGRFWLTMFATILAFGSCFLIAHFANIYRSLKGLLVSLSLVSIFGVYQFLGDLVWNLPVSWTGLRPQYTKVVFGYPRVQATAIEPLYLAGMLFWPIFLLILLLLNRLKFSDFFGDFWEGFKSKKTKIVSEKFGNYKLFYSFFNFALISKKFFWQFKVSFLAILDKSSTNYKSFYKSLNNSKAENFEVENFEVENYKFKNSSLSPLKSIFLNSSFLNKVLAIIFRNKSFLTFFISKINFLKSLNWLFLVLFLTVFILTFSKSGWLILLFLAFGILVIYSRFLSLKFWQNFLRLGFLVILGIGILSLILPSLSSSLSGIGSQFAEIASGNAPTISERNEFLKVAMILLPENAILGIGSGQYGVWAKKFFGDGEGFLIVNNVYLEVWLEFGFLSFVSFLLFLFSPIWQFWRQVFSQKVPDLTLNSINSEIIESKSLSNLQNKKLIKLEIEKLEMQNLEVLENSTVFLKNIEKENQKKIQENDKNEKLQILKNLEINKFSINQNWQNLEEIQIHKIQIHQIQIQEKIHKTIGQSLVAALLAYYLQWLSFSPIFINPIFILLGVMLAFLRENGLEE